MERACVAADYSPKYGTGMQGVHYTMAPYSGHTMLVGKLTAATLRQPRPGPGSGEEAQSPARWATRYAAEATPQQGGASACATLERSAVQQWPVGHLDIR